MDRAYKLDITSL